jgi:predicted amidophosphoribosyltransferase
MPSVTELSAVYGNFLIGPRDGPGVCRACFNLTDGYDRCYACAHTPQCLDAILPISYSVAHEQLHHVLATYKRSHGATPRRFTVELAAVLWRHLARHESCLARAASTPSFDLVAVVPSSDRQRDDVHPLRHIVAELVTPTRNRYARVLQRSSQAVAPHNFSAEKYEVNSPVSGRSVLLIDDTWTTGANAQSAAAALKQAGATNVASLVVGRHVNREWGQNDRILRALETPFDWDRCARCRPQTGALYPAAEARLATGGRG